MFMNGNIHGNEKEGTDAIIRVVEQYATSTDPAVEQLLQRNILDLQRHVEPGRAHRQHARQRRGLRPQPRPDDRLPAGGPADPRPDRRAPADHHARPARLREPDADAPEHAAAQRQQRVRPLHQARPAERARDRAGSPAWATPRSRARGSPSATRPGGRTTSRRSTCRRSPCCRAASRTRSRRRSSRAAAARRRAGPTSTPTSRVGDQDLAEVHPVPPQRAHLRPGRGLPPRLGGRAAARHPRRLVEGWGPEDNTQQRSRVPYVIPAGCVSVPRRP